MLLRVNYLPGLLLNFLCLRKGDNIPQRVENTGMIFHDVMGCVESRNIAHQQSVKGIVGKKIL